MGILMTDDFILWFTFDPWKNKFKNSFKYSFIKMLKNRKSRKCRSFCWERENLIEVQMNSRVGYEGLTL